MKKKTPPWSARIMADKEQKIAYTDGNAKRAALLRKLCAMCGGTFAKHRGDKCFCEPDCNCDQFMKREGDTL